MKRNLYPFLDLILLSGLLIGATQILPNGMKVDMKTYMAFIDPNDGTKFFSVKLVEDWTWPQNGIVLKKGTSITVAEPDILQTGIKNRKEAVLWIKRHKESFKKRAILTSL